MSDGRECRTCGGKWSIRDASQCPFCRCDGYRKEIEALKAEVAVRQSVIDGLVTAYPQIEDAVYAALNHKDG